MSSRPAAVYRHRRVKGFTLAMRRLEKLGMLTWAKGRMAHACHDEVNAARSDPAIADRWVASRKKEVPDA